LNNSSKGFLMCSAVGITSHCLLLSDVKTPEPSKGINKCCLANVSSSACDYAVLLLCCSGRVRSDVRRAQVKVCASAVADLQKKHGEQPITVAGQQQQQQSSAA
jgi:hypothetical protein